MPNSKAGENSNTRCKGQYPDVQCEIERSIEKPDQQARAPCSEQHAEDRTYTRQQQALGQQLANQAATPPADGHPDCDLALPRRTAGEQQVRHVGARDQQHHANDRHQNDQRQLVFPADIGDSVGSRLRIEGLAQVPVPVLRPQLAATFVFETAFVESRLHKFAARAFSSGP